jgi:glycyl-tRNA synthetase beta subunit
MPAFLKRLRLDHGAIEVDSTPRRLVVRAANVAARQPDTNEKIRGPPAKVATLNACTACHTDLAREPIVATDCWG